MRNVKIFGTFEVDDQNNLASPLKKAKMTSLSLLPPVKLTPKHLRESTQEIESLQK